MFILSDVGELKKSLFQMYWNGEMSVCERMDLVWCRERNDEERGRVCSCD